MKAIAIAIFMPLLLAFSVLIHAALPSNTDSKEDSILNVIHSSDIDSVKFHNYIKLCDLFNYNDAGKSIEYAQKAISVAEEIEYHEGIARGYERMATAYFQLGEHIIAQDNYLKAREANKKAYYYEIEASILYNLGNIQYELGNYGQSSEYALEAGELFLSHDDSIGYGVTRYMISGNQGATGNYDQAIETALEALGIFQRKNVRSWEIYAFDKLVHLYNVQQKYDESLKILETNLAYHQNSENAKFTAITYRMIGDIYLILEDYENARTALDSSFTINSSHGFKQEEIKTLYSLGLLEYETQHIEKAQLLFDRGLKLSMDLDDALFKCSNYLGLGKCLYEQQDYTAAIHMLEESIALAKRIGNMENLRDGYLFLSMNYQELDQPAMALTNYKSYKQFSDSITAQENKRQFAELTSKYEAAEKEQQISRLQEEKNEVQVNNRRVIALWMLTIIVSVLILVIVILAWQKNKQLLATEKELDKIKSRFFANISHEFRTPLTLILGPLHDLIKKEESRPFHAELTLIENNARRLLTLINQILDLSKLDAGKYRLNVVRADLIAMMKRAVWSFHSLAEMKKIELSFDADVDALDANFDPEMVETMLNNLMSNALKFEPEGGHIKVKVQARETGKKEQVTWSVTNRGSSISAEDQDQIFNRFFQSEGTQDFGKGSGIGLALVRELVELHEGSIRVESSVEYGTSFVIQLTSNLPLSSPQGTVDTQVRNRRSEASPSVPVAAGNKEEGKEASSGEEENGGNLPVVLVVEDHSEVMNYIHSVLAKDYQVKKAWNGQEGIEEAKTLIPDIIISDVMMPVKDGTQMVNELKNHELTSHIPIILLTAKASIESRLEGLESKADGYLTKPFHGDELKLRIRNMLDARNKLRDKYSKELILKSQHMVVKSMDEAFVEKLCQNVEDNIANEDFSVEELARNIGLSRSQLHRKLEAITGKSASQFIREYRLERARELIEKKVGTIAEISFQVGFSSPGYFNKCFKEYFKTTPGELHKSTDNL
jgi:signal transduction histidine kinase/DNA-binding response OmpR family regulator